MSPALHRPTARHLRSFVAVPLRPQTYLNLLYLALAFPLGVLYFVLFVVGLSLGISLTILVIGIPLLLLVVAGALVIATFERWLARVLLGVEFPDTTTTGSGASGSETASSSGDESAASRDRDSTTEPTTGRRSADPEEAPGELRARLGTVVSVLTDLGTWKAVAYLPSKFVVGIAAFLLMVTLLTTAVALLLAPLYYHLPGVYVGVVTDRPIELHPTLHLGWNRLLVTLETAITVGYWRITRLSEALVVAMVGALLALLSLHLLNWLAMLSGVWTRWMLHDSPDPIDVIRTRLGD